MTMKLANGNTLMTADTFTATLRSVKGRFDLYQSATEYALVHWFDHGDKMKAERLFSAFVGTSGKLIGDGRLLAAYVNAYCYGFKLEADGTLKVENKKNGKPKPRGFKGRNESGDLSWKVGGYHLGFADTLPAYMKADAQRKAEAKAEREAKAAEAEALAEAAKAAEAESKANDESEAEGDSGAPDYARATTLAEALRVMREAFQSGTTRDVEALAEAKAEAKALADAIAQRMAEAAEAEAADQSEAAESEAEAEATESEAAEA